MKFWTLQFGKVRAKFRRILVYEQANLPLEESCLHCQAMMSTASQQLVSLLLFWTCPHRIRGRVGVVSSSGVSLPYLVASDFGIGTRVWMLEWHSQR